MEFSNDPGTKGGGIADQAKIRQLLNNLRLLRLRADRDRDASLSGLLDDIELVLLELAHSGPFRSRKCPAAQHAAAGKRDRHENESV